MAALSGIVPLVDQHGVVLRHCGLVAVYFRSSHLASTLAKFTKPSGGYKHVYVRMRERIFLESALGDLDYPAGDTIPENAFSRAAN
jgi:hypothetical protein